MKGVPLSLLLMVGLQLIDVKLNIGPKSNHILNEVPIMIPDLTAGAIILNHTVPLLINEVEIHPHLLSPEDQGVVHQQPKGPEHMLHRLLTQLVNHPVLGELLTAHQLLHLPALPTTIIILNHLLTILLYLPFNLPNI